MPWQRLSAYSNICRKSKELILIQEVGLCFIANIRHDCHTCQDGHFGLFARMPETKKKHHITKPGYYGNPSIGIACQVCPCAQVQGGYSTECYLEADFQVRCNCPYGYEGRRCEQCSPGYARQQDNQCVQVSEETCPPGEIF